jgi:hypothetical protein
MAKRKFNVLYELMSLSSQGSLVVTCDCSFAISRQEPERSEETKEQD